MKQELKKIIKRIDALSLRERVIMFAAASLCLLLLLNWFVLDPQFAKQKKLSEQIRQDQATMSSIEASIQQRLKTRNDDPDAAERARLASLRQQLKQAQTGLLDMQKGLVSPDRMSSLLEDILKKNTKLKLVSLKTLPVTGLTDNAASDEKKPGEQAAAKDNKDAQPAEGAIYKHGVEITVQGNYLDMLTYMDALENMPWQLFWGKAKLNVDDYPQTTLSLTLFTLSLDKKWLNL